ncbi:MAG TPA: Mrp/NBP35 family ATP-binding protein [Candidatus Nanopelagicaceae bacterium]|nr:Mrp/NBP35 family ATP-binding protein [Candidatus Nanopelagicaceae bacterium]
MQPDIETLIRQSLATVIDPELHRPITDLGMVETIAFADGRVDLRILLTISGCPMRDRLSSDINRAVGKVATVTNVTIDFGVMNEEQRNNVRTTMRGGSERVIQFAQPGSLTRVYGIASGKGGVGKSSVAVNLAIALAKLGRKVGILDADVYGHSIPRLMGLVGQRPTAIDQMFIPLESHGVKVVSMEMFKPQREDPVAYRGPLLHRVLEQLLVDAFWGDLDDLLIDLPPGTGDLAMSLGSLIPNSEIIVVTTPQLAAAEVAERAGRIAHQLRQRIVGVVENMSAFPCPHCGEPVDLFGQGGGDAAAAALSKLVGSDVPLFGAIPFEVALREGGDGGSPIVVADPDSPAARAISQIASILAARTRGLSGLALGISPVKK